MPRERCYKIELDLSTNWRSVLKNLKRYKNFKVWGRYTVPVSKVKLVLAFVAKGIIKSTGDSFSSIRTKWSKGKTVSWRIIILARNICCSVSFQGKSLSLSVCFKQSLWMLPKTSKDEDAVDMRGCNFLY